MKERARARAEETIMLTIVKEQDDSGRGHWAAVTDGPPKRKEGFNFIRRIHRSFGADNRSMVAH